MNADGYIGANGDIPGYNMFAYCSNNPITYSDPCGKWFWDVVKAIGEALVVVGVVTLAVVATVSTGGGAAICALATAGAATTTVASAAVITTVEVAVAATAAGMTAIAAAEIGSSISFSKTTNDPYQGDSTYNRDGVRVDYEANGNGTGNVHIHNGKNPKEVIFRITRTSTNRMDFTNSIKKLIDQSPQIAKAIEKAIRFLEDLCE